MRSRKINLLVLFSIINSYCLADENLTFNPKILIQNSISICTLDIKDNVAELSVKEKAILEVNTDDLIGYAANYNPEFIDGKGVYPSTLIDHKVVKVTRNGEQERFEIKTARNGKKFIKIFPKDGKGLSRGVHVYEIWYKAKNRVIPGVKMQSFNYLVGDRIPVKNVDLSVYLGDNLSLTNIKLDPHNDSLVVRSDNRQIRIYNDKDVVKALGHTEFTINFKQDKESQAINTVATITNKHIPTNIFILFLERNIQRIDFIIALVLAVISLGTLLWHIRQLCKKS